MCCKCSSTKHLHLHHIVPLTEEQIDTEDNLITLCSHCHSEWEHIVYIRTSAITFEKWLLIPPALTLIVAFAVQELWTDEFTAKQALESVLQMHQIHRTIREIELAATN